MQILLVEHGKFYQNLVIINVQQIIQKKYYYFCFLWNPQTCTINVDYQPNSQSQLPEGTKLFNNDDDKRIFYTCDRYFTIQV